MSTKTSISTGKDHHIYYDMGDDRVYMKVSNVQFEAYPETVIVELPDEVIDLMPGVASTCRQLVDLSDDTEK